jgi:hypothetical protein
VAFANLNPSDMIPPAVGEEEADQLLFPAQEEPQMESTKPQSGQHWSQSANSAGMRELPVTLPSSLAVAVFRLPVPMSETDFKTLVNLLTAMKDKLVGSLNPDKDSGKTRSE